MRASRAEWSRCIEAFLAHRTILAVNRETRIGLCRAAKMVRALRGAMAADMPEPFSGVCEADETFVGGQRKNKPRQVRRVRGKSGHGTEKLPIVGVISRRTGQVAVRVVPFRSEETVIGFMVSRLRKGAILYTDGYKMNRAVRKHGIRHHYVNHHLGEFKRHDIHTNRIEGFWGVLKRRLMAIGGIRRARFPEFVGEVVWRFNHRRLTAREQKHRLLHLLLPK